MAFDFLRRHSLLTHGSLGWWWARRYNYPGDDHGVRIPVYGWVDAEVADTARHAAPEVMAPRLVEPETVETEVIDTPSESVDRIATFTPRA